MLAGTGFGDDALLAHAPGEQPLAERVVDFVRAGVEEVFALEVDSGAAELLRQALGEIERSGTASEVMQKLRKLGLERRVGLCGFVLALKLDQSGHEGLRHVAAAVDAEAAGPRLRESRGKNDG